MKYIDYFFKLIKINIDVEKDNLSKLILELNKHNYTRLWVTEKFHLGDQITVYPAKSKNEKNNIKFILDKMKLSSGGFGAYSDIEWQYVKRDTFEYGYWARVGDKWEKISDDSIFQFSNYQF